MQESPAQFRLGITLAILAATGFAAKAIFVKLAYRHGVDAISLLTLRLGYTLPILGIVWLLRGGERGAPLTWRDRGWLILLGLLGYYLSSLFDFLGLQTVSASLERMILYLYPTLTVLFSALLTRTAISRRIWQALPLTYAGIALVMLPEFQAMQADLAGVLLIVASTVCYALYLTWSPAVITRVGAMRFTELALSVSALAMLLHFALTRPISGLAAQPLAVHGWSVLMALLSTVLPIYALAAAMRRIGAGRAAVVGSFGPLLTIMMSMGVLDEHFAPLQWSGVMLVFLGVWLVSRAPRPGVQPLVSPASQGGKASKAG
ncbi:MAG: EamA family transporter [Candidatus Dactylopiibacterium carminicum]|uniref:EamA family transporter n=1 Tax=Candidatus Dactylopiibacterium carminicum TaxID=857335 RepID=A0A272EYX7_9RHOO|nr:DMT family transporter [Candidatus Dactylopiibacterium carminicum]KAF7600812.1 EamA/RhaT family transporter [Candidatus Dactylopiibacterium carminicum]PAS95311.1 MAG: EamA family transporter [Candidatus Dactylopiibacterium carminicum]PAS98677.1 MAG: EamA family transporter [Candidatus Dactylopiibacterium carminicum]PAT00818.1 MAG: EamA family transporter [Candidatus Dactylopiibacterium carminicum]